MEDFKVDFLERIKALLQKEDIEGLGKFMTKIHKHIENDQEFNEVRDEITKGNYVMALAITEELLYENGDDAFTYGEDEDEDEDEFGGGGGGYGSSADDNFSEEEQY